MIKKLKLLYLTVVLLIASGITVFGQTSAFTYQGRFTDSTVAQPTNGTYSMTFRLYDALSGGTQIGSPVTTSVSVVNGIFAAQLDFGAAAFDTTGARYLEMQVAASTLTPRQEINSTPFSVRAVNSAAADSLSASCSLCVQNGQLAANSVTTSKVANGTVTEFKLADEAVSSLKIANGTIVNGDISTTAAIDGTKITGSTITNLNASNLGSGIVPVARLGTNTPTATTFLRGDNTWQAVSGGGGATLQVAATNTAAQNVGGATTVLVSFNSVATSPTAGTFNGTTFTASVAGTYLVNANFGGTGSPANSVYPAILVNGSPVAYGVAVATSSLGSVPNRANISMTVFLAAGDTVAIQAQNSSPAGNGSNFTTDGSTRLAITKLN